ncbi:MAG TPA: SGNH/GDSL hydrolase family protein, partial [Rariglobus sp.]
MIGWLACGVSFASVGNDVVAVFARAERGEPLRYVAIGGSITQASGDGWAGEWLRGRFPKSDVTVVNSGMSATGSSLGVFRIERDISVHQPDLVAIEYCVNDGGLGDEEAVRYMETMVVRLKSLPHPPAIVIVEAAARGGVNLERHRRVARHYGLAEVDMQAAMDAKGAAAWDEYFSDNVHPNKAGHAFYAETMRGVLEPLAERARLAEVEARQTVLPAPLSEKPLLLDARMVPLQGYIAPGWKADASLPAWWNRFFQGGLGAGEPGAVLRVPFRGTTVGVFYAMNKDYGSFFAGVDGGLPCHVFTNTRGGYSSIILGNDLPAREHVLTLVLPGKSETDARLNGPVKLGYLLVAGETGAGREASP